MKKTVYAVVLFLTVGLVFSSCGKIKEKVNGLIKGKPEKIEYEEIPEEEQNVIETVESSNVSKLKGYEWLEGVWAGAEDPYNFARMIVTDSYIQSVSSVQGDVFDKVEEMPQQDYELKIRHINYVSGYEQDVLGFNEIYCVDEQQHCIYIMPGEHTPGIFLHKIQSYTLESAVLIANTQYPSRVFSNAYDGFVNIRQSPQGKAPILGVLRNGPEGAVLLERGNDWTMVNCQGIVGYVATQYIQDTPTEEFQGAALSNELLDLFGRDASVYLFTDSDLRSLSAKDLTYLRNSVYAKHGYVFNSQELNNYFKQFGWYHPNSSVTESALNSVEKTNVAFIKNFQELNGKTYKPQ